MSQVSLMGLFPGTQKAFNVYDADADGNLESTSPTRNYAASAPHPHLKGNYGVMYHSKTGRRITYDNAKLSPDQVCPAFCNYDRSDGADKSAIKVSHGTTAAAGHPEYERYYLSRLAILHTIFKDTKTTLFQT